MAQAAEFFDMRVGNARMLQRFRQRVAIELRIVPRTRNGSDVDQSFDSMLPKQTDKFANRARGMADRQNQRRPAPAGIQIVW